MNSLSNFVLPLRKECLCWVSMMPQIHCIFFMFVGLLCYCKDTLFLIINRLSSCVFAFFSLLLYHWNTKLIFLRWNRSILLWSLWPCWVAPCGQACIAIVVPKRRWWQIWIRLWRPAPWWSHTDRDHRQKLIILYSHECSWIDHEFLININSEKFVVNPWWCNVQNTIAECSLMVQIELFKSIGWVENATSAT